MKLIPYLKLIRVPNLFTVPGDPLSGFFLASVSLGPVLLWQGLGPVVLSSLCLYMAGLISNDLFDRVEDSIDRPERPIPSGDVAFSIALFLFFLSSCAAIALAFLASRDCGFLAGIILGLSLAYNAGIKRWAVLGPLVMGLCRGLNLLLGAFVVCRWRVVPQAVVIACVGVSIYIALVTTIARHETKEHAPGFLRWLPVVAMLGTGLAVGVTSPVSTILAYGILLVATIAWLVRVAQSLKGQCAPAVISKSIGGYLKGLILLHATLVAVLCWPGLVFSALLLLGMGGSIRLGKWFYAS